MPLPISVVCSLSLALSLVFGGIILLSHLLIISLFLSFFFCVHYVATIFGQLWRLEPLPIEKKSMWRREMEWLLCVSDHIVELIPTWQTFPDGSKLEVVQIIVLFFSSELSSY